MSGSPDSEGGLVAGGAIGVGAVTGRGVAGVVRGRQIGDRHAFLAGANARVTKAVPANPAHPRAVRPASVPVVRTSALDPDDLIGSFVRNAEAVGAVVHRVSDLDGAGEAIEQIVDDEGATHIVASSAPLARRLGARVDAAPYTRVDGAAADIGITEPVAAIASTGTLVQRSDDEGGRGASLLPRVHVALVTADRIVASSAEVLRTLPDRPLPANVALVTGPSRTGDIEMILTMGVHGPLRVHIVLIG